MYVTGCDFRDVAGHRGQIWGTQQKRPMHRDWTMSKKPCIPLLATELVSLQTRALSYNLECDGVQLAMMADTDINFVKDILWDVKGLFCVINYNKKEFLDIFLFYAFILLQLCLINHWEP